MPSTYPGSASEMLAIAIGEMKRAIEKDIVRARNAATPQEANAILAAARTNALQTFNEARHWYGTDIPNIFDQAYLHGSQGLGLGKPPQANQAKSKMKKAATQAVRRMELSTQQFFTKAHDEVLITG